MADRTLAEAALARSIAALERAGELWLEARAAGRGTRDEDVAWKQAMSDSRKAERKARKRRH